MRWILGLAAAAAVIAVYVALVRPWMRATPWGKAFLDWIEPIERALWLKSETILWARAKIVTGVLLTALTQAGTIDITPLMPFVPDAYEGLVKTAWNMLPMVITVVGMLDEHLRKDTTKPIEIVAMRTDAPEEVKEAVEIAVAATEAAKAAVVEAKAV